MNTSFKAPSIIQSANNQKRALIDNLDATSDKKIHEDSNHHLKNDVEKEIITSTVKDTPTTKVDHMKTDGIHINRSGGHITETTTGKVSKHVISATKTTKVLKTVPIYRTTESRTSTETVLKEKPSHTLSHITTTFANDEEITTSISHSGMDYI